jgi:transcriptional regulator with XRE-family HTH domain
MPPVAKPKRQRRPTYLRSWRKFRGYSLETAAEQIEMSRENLGRIERGEVPYSQDVLEQLAEAYNCEVADLLIRDPLEPLGIWSIWDAAKPAERLKIVDVAKVLVQSPSDDDDPKPRAPQSQEQSRRTSAKRRAG